MTTPPGHATFAYVGACVDELARSGLRHVCVAPGSRSTPLALTIASHPALRIWMHLDERSAAFFALGMARALGEPVALLCTSGTAAANFFPAVIEARSSCVPLLVLTADRPPELRDVGAAQTIDQNRLYGAYPKWFVEVAIADTTPDLLRYARTLACRAVATAAAAPAGPVHLNFPFREPLTPVAVEPPADISRGDALAWHGRPGGLPWVHVADAPPHSVDETVRDIASRLRDAHRPLLICGPQFDPNLAAPLAALAAALDAPLLVDPLSQVRWGPHERCALVDRYDAVLRDAGASAALAPDLILRIGALPTSKPVLQYLQKHATVHQIVVDAARWPDPTLLASQMIHADPRSFCEQLLPHVSNNSAARSSRTLWLQEWLRLDTSAGATISNFIASLDVTFDGTAMAEIVSVIPDGGTLVVSSSMPVRDLDAFVSGDSRSLRVLANRGANGIDGVVSTALGVAATLKPDAPLVLVIGDIAFYHDMNGLLAAKLHQLNATIVVLNNDGGGIFSFLPQASEPAHFEQLFGTPHGLTFSAVAELYGATYCSAESTAALRDAVVAGIRGAGLHIIELRSDRARNAQLHHDAWRMVADALKPTA